MPFPGWRSLTPVRCLAASRSALSARAVATPLDPGHLELPFVERALLNDQRGGRHVGADASAGQDLKPAAAANLAGEIASDGNVLGVDGGGDVAPSATNSVPSQVTVPFSSPSTRISRCERNVPSNAEWRSTRLAVSIETSVSGFQSRSGCGEFAHRAPPSSVDGGVRLDGRDAVNCRVVRRRDQSPPFAERATGMGDSLPCISLEEAMAISPARSAPSWITMAGDRTSAVTRPWGRISKRSECSGSTRAPCPRSSHWRRR